MTGGGRHEVDLGDTVTIRITSDVTDRIHLHGYDLQADVSAGETAELAFDATIPGVRTAWVSVLAANYDGTPEQAWRWVPSLVPIVFGYTIARYFSLLAFEGPAFVALLSDPLGEGWDLLGTASNLIDFTVVSPNHIAYVQVGAIVIGHVSGWSPRMIVPSSSTRSGSQPRASTTRSASWSPTPWAGCSSSSTPEIGFVVLTGRSIHSPMLGAVLGDDHRHATVCRR